MNKLQYGKIYNVQLSFARRKAIYLGKLNRKGMIHKHVIVTYPHKDGGIRMYRFSGYEVGGDKLSIDNFVEKTPSKSEEEYLLPLLKTKSKNRRT